MRRNSTATAKRNPRFRFNMASKDVPATNRTLHLVRSELKSEMRAGFSRIDSKFSGMDSKFSGMDSKFSGMDSKFSGLESRFASIDSKFASIDSRLANMDAQFARIDAKFAGLDSKFARIDSKFSDVDSKLERVLSEVFRIGVLVEEQHANNRITLEGLTGLWQRQSRVETRVDEVEKTVRSIARTKS